MLRVLFFGRFREELGCAELELVLDDSSADLDSLQSRLAEERGDKWSQVLMQPNVIRAVNQTVANENLSLCDGDEIAFFPPVTGG